MKITVHVDQARALREGIDAPHSTARIEVDPAELTQSERDLLALLLRNGHDTTESGLIRPKSPDDEPVGGLWQGPAAARLVVVEPSMAGLRRGIAELLAWHAAETAEIARKRAEEDAAIDAAIEAGERELVGVRLDSAREPWTTRSTHGPTVELPKKLPWLATSCASPEAKARLEEAKATIAAERARLLEPIATELRRRRDEETARNAARDAELQGEYDALYQRLPESLRQRHEAGYASDGEVHNAMRRLALEDVGQSSDDWSTAANPGSEELTRLTDAEFAALKAAREAAPEGATVRPMLIWLRHYRPATDDELADGLGDEDDEIEEREDERRVLLVEWKVGRLGVTAVVSLPGAS